MPLTIEVDTKPLERLLVNAFQIDGEAILYGIPSPAPMHKGKGGRPGRITTAFTLARVEFGSKPKPKKSPRRSQGRGRSLLGRARRSARKLLGRLLGGFARRPMPRPRVPKAKPTPTDPGRQRPVIRWVAATQRGVMTDGFRAAMKRALRGKDPRPDLDVLGGKLAKLTQDRLTAVGGVQTGQTRDAITHKIVRRFGPDGGGPVASRRG